MRRWIQAAAGVLVVCAVLSVCTFAGTCAEVRDSVVRLHILAHSDSDADQALKLKVRDAVTAAGAGLLDGVTTRADAEKRLQAALPELVEVAQQCVYENGFSYPVTAEVTTMCFTTRVYENGTFPAGQYHTVRFCLGDGAGKNWWCVLYPPLCVSAATDKTSLSDVMSEDACDTVENAPRYAVRFKVVEWWEMFWEWVAAA